MIITWYKSGMRIPCVPPDILESQREQYAGLMGLLLDSSADDDTDAPSVADRVARGCLAEGHLWRAMNLSSREELRSLLELHFPALAAENTKDMRWKKYLYKRLCGWPGFHG